MQVSNIKALSIKTCYADLIINGSKTIELRKRPIGLDVGNLILLYETLPASKIKGGFIADRTVCLPVSEMWQRHNQIMGVEKSFYDEYFTGVDKAFGTFIYRSYEFPELNLAEIMERCPGFVAPQATIGWKKSWEVLPEWEDALRNSQMEMIETGQFTPQLDFFSGSF